MDSTVRCNKIAFFIFYLLFSTAERFMPDLPIREELIGFGVAEPFILEQPYLYEITNQDLRNNLSKQLLFLFHFNIDVNTCWHLKT